MERGNLIGIGGEVSVENRSTDGSPFIVSCLPCGVDIFKAPDVSNERIRSAIFGAKMSMRSHVAGAMDRNHSFYIDNYTPPEPIRHIAPIDSIRLVQDIGGHASIRLAPHETPQDILVHIGDELQETREAVETGDRHDVASEVPDLVILAFRLADMYGIDMAEAITRKLERNGTKYAMQEVQKLVDSGMSYKEARLTLKGRWDRQRDKDYNVT